MANWIWAARTGNPLLFKLTRLGPYPKIMSTKTLKKPFDTKHKHTKTTAWSNRDEEVEL